MRPNEVPVFVAASASVNQTSADIKFDFMVRMSAQASFTGTPNGNIQIQVSNDPNNGQAPSVWSNLGSATAVVSGATVLIPYQEMCYPHVRFVWTNTSSTGTITLRMFAFGV